MKLALYIIISIAFLVASFFLYQNSLGAIPFLTISISLFILVLKIQSATKGKKTANHSKKWTKE